MSPEDIARRAVALATHVNEDVLVEANGLEFLVHASHVRYAFEAYHHARMLKEVAMREALATGKAATDEVHE